MTHDTCPDCGLPTTGPENARCLRWLTIAKLRAQLDQAEQAARYEGNIADQLKADLARVTAERDEAVGEAARLSDAIEDGYAVVSTRPDAGPLSSPIASLKQQIVDRAIAQYYQARPAAGPDPLIAGLIALLEAERKPVQW
jgi:hypothetical protein